MTTIDIKDLFPEPNGSAEYDKIKSELPRNILSKYAKAIDAKYSGKISASVIDIKKNENILGYAFYIDAEIGFGFSYRLLEVECSIQGYPLEITFFKNEPQTEKNILDGSKLEEKLQLFFKEKFVRTLIFNLLAQVESSSDRLPF